MNSIFCIIKINEFDVKEDNSTIVLDQHSRSSNVGPTTVLQLLKLECCSNVGRMSARQQ